MSFNQHHECDKRCDGFVKLNLFSFVMTTGVIYVGDENFSMLCPITGIIKSLGMVTFPITSVIASHFKILFSKTHHGHDAHNLDHSKGYHGHDDVPEALSLEHHCRDSSSAIKPKCKVHFWYIFFILVQIDYFPSLF